jgi:hypothetical protein
LYHFSNLAYNTQYFWRIAAINDTSKSHWSNIYRFTTELGAPTIQYPADNAESVPVDFEISWNVDEDISYYSIQIASDAEFKNILVEYNKIYDLKYGLSLDENTIYYCRVKATTDDNFSKWSKIVKFKTYDPNSIKDERFAVSIAYPNPVSTSFSLSEIPAEAFSYEIFDNLGTKRGEGLLGKEIEVSFLPSGIYFLKLNTSLRPLKFIKL